MVKYCKVAVTAVSLLVCVLLIVLWVRSYSHADQLIKSNGVNRAISCASMEGQWILSSGTSKSVDPRVLTEDGLMFQTVPRKYWKVQSAPLFQKFKATKTSLIVPHWFFIVIAAAIAVAPWMKWRFSLRTLLIVMTLFALFFGAVACAAIQLGWYCSFPFVRPGVPALTNFSAAIDSQGINS